MILSIFCFLKSYPKATPMYHFMQYEAKQRSQTQENSENLDFKIIWRKSKLGHIKKKLQA